MTISMITCMTQDMVIGVDGDLLIPIKPDMIYFKKTTINHVVVMGKNTYLSLPGAKPLKDRINIIISSTLYNNPPEGFTVYKSIDAFMAAYADYKDEIFVIGGNRIYDAFMPYANKLYITLVKRESIGLLKDFGKPYEKVTKFPSSICDYKWYYTRVNGYDDLYMDKKYGIIPYEFLIFTKR